MKTEVTATMTITAKYWIDSENCETDDLQEAIQIDQENFLDDPSFFLDMADDITLTIKEVENGTL